MGRRDVTLGRSLPSIVLVIAVGAIVAITANGLQLLRAPLALDGAWEMVVRALGVALAAAAIAGLLSERRRMAAARSGPDPTRVGLRAAATIMGAVLLLGLLNPPSRTPGDARSGGPLSLLPRSPWGSDAKLSESLEATTRGGDPLVEGGTPLPAPQQLSVEVLGPDDGLIARMRSLASRALLFVLILMVLWYVMRRVRPSPGRLEFGTLLDPADAEASLAGSLRLIQVDGRDPRGQITNAYLRLLMALEAAGAPRKPQEAPHEHLDRVLGPLGVGPEPLHRLTGLYVLAQFGARPVTHRDRAAAATALEASLADLRAHASIPPEAGWALEQAGL